MIKQDNLELLLTVFKQGYYYRIADNELQRIPVNTITYGIENTLTVGYMNYDDELIYKIDANGYKKDTGSLYSTIWFMSSEEASKALKKQVNETELNLLENLDKQWKYISKDSNSFYLLDSIPVTEITCSADGFFTLENVKNISNFPYSNLFNWIPNNSFMPIAEAIQKLKEVSYYVD